MSIFFLLAGARSIRETAISVNIIDVYRSYFLVIIDVNLSLSIKYFFVVYLLNNI